MIMKLGMGPLRRKVYVVDINNDPVFALIFFTASTKTVIIAYCADFRSRYQVSVYISIGTLVFVLLSGKHKRNVQQTFSS